MFFLRKLKRFIFRIVNLGGNSDLGKKALNYPIKVELISSKGSLKFEAFSSVEYFRIAQYGDEKDFVVRFTEALAANDVVFDIGASVGLMTVHAAIFTNDGRVFAFEPDPDTFERLTHNVGLNNFSNVEFVTWAASDANGETVLFTDGASGFAPSLREQTNRPSAPKTTVRVQTRRIDDAILSGDLPLPTVLKIDIEGAEVLCLKGASKLLTGELGNQPRLIFLELHPFFLPSFNSSAAEVHSFVLNCGYSVLWEQKRDDQIHYCYQKNANVR